MPTLSLDVISNYKQLNVNDMCCSNSSRLESPFKDANNWIWCGSIGRRTSRAHVYFWHCHWLHGCLALVPWVALQSVLKLLPSLVLALAQYGGLAVEAQMRDYVASTCR